MGYRVIFSLILLLLLNACHSQEATVTKINSNATSNQPESQQVGDISKPSNNIPSPSREVKTMVYFSGISTDFRRKPMRSNGIGFLASSSRSTQPFSYHFENRDLDFNAQVFVPTTNGVLHAWQSGTNESTLSLFEPKTRKTKNLSSFFSQRITSLSALNNLDIIAWVDSKGFSWVFKRNLSRPLQINSNGLFINEVQVIETSKEVFLTGTTRANETQFLVFSSEHLKSPSIRLIAEIAKFNPGGSKIAYSKKVNQHSTLEILDREKNQTSVVINNEEMIHEISWKNDQELTYTSTATDGLTSLHLLDLNSRVDAILASLHFQYPQIGSANIACPAWDGNNIVFFSDFQNGIFSIYRAINDGQSWNIELFSHPTDETSGFLCPKVLSGRGI